MISQKDDSNADVEAVRLAMLRAIRSGRRRVLKHEKDCPTEWRPQTVRNPGPYLEGALMTDGSAWQLIERLLDEGTPLVAVEQRQPPCIAYELVAGIYPQMPNLYIKLLLRDGYVLGRSFHWSIK